MMGSLQRPLVAAAAFAIASASASTDLSDKFSSSTTEQSKSPPLPRVLESNSFVVSKFSDFSLLSRLHVPPPNTIPTNYSIFSSGSNTLFQSSSSSSSPILLNSYRSAELAKTPKQTTLFSNNVKSTSSSSEVLYKWHLPETTNEVTRRNKKRTVVVLLGWLGAKQKHLKRYAEWYTSRGFHVITFTFPMAEILSYKVGGKAEEHVHLLANHLADWLEEEEAKNMVFHTFSNTGWLTYGAILEKFQEQDPSLMGRIKGCIVDSAPVAAPDPQVWASGFSAAVLKKQSVATKGLIMGSNEVAAVETKPAVTEAALLLVLEKLFEVVLNLPTVSRRLSDVLGQLSSRQPTCPQLYIYSSADRVIPVSCVESFIEEQRRSGHEVRSCDFVSTPHVDHFRNDPQLYTNQLTQFLEDCVLTSSK